MQIRQRIISKQNWLVIVEFEWYCEKKEEDAHLLFWVISFFDNSEVWWGVMRSPAFVTCLQHHIPRIQQNQAFSVLQTLISVQQEIISLLQDRQFQTAFYNPLRKFSGRVFVLFRKVINEKTSFFLLFCL